MIDIENNTLNQQTISSPILIEGIGLHSGINVSMRLLPAEADFGIRFFSDRFFNLSYLEIIFHSTSIYQKNL